MTTIPCLEVDPRTPSTYCKTDKLRDVRPSFTQKTTVKDGQGKFEQADVHDFNFRVSLSKEKDLPSGGRFVGGIEDSWDDSKKAFRYIQRHTLTSPSSLPMVLVDLSVVRESRGSRFSAAAWCIRTS